MKKLLLLFFFFQTTTFLIAQWGSQIVVDNGGSDNVGETNMCAIVSGNPAIAYYDRTNLDLYYIRATDASGTSWGSRIMLDGSGIAVGNYLWLGIVAGNPAVSYYDNTGLELRYVRANDATGSSWGSPVSISDPAAQYGQFTSIAIVDGNPAICYYDVTNNDLKYVRATNSTGSAWDPAVTVVSSSDDVGSHNTLLVVNGNPAIHYWNITDGDLYYVRASNTSGSAWDPPILVDDGGSDDVGSHAWMTIVNGNPAINYYDATDDDLLFVRATNASGTSWGTPVTVDATGNVGLFNSMAIVNGNPAISYYDATNDNLKYARATDASGTSWNSLFAATSADNIGISASLVVANGNPAISYHNTTTNELEFVRATNTTGLPVELIRFTGTSKPEGIILNWETATEINNNGFDIEWSSDNRTWKNIGFVKGSGDSYEKQSYQFTHDNPDFGINYYRLKQLDFDGAFEYSDVVSVELAVSFEQLAVSPNPVQNGELTLTLQNPDFETGQVELINTAGQSVIIQQISDLTVKMDVSTLSSGVYWLNAVIDGKRTQEKVIIQ